MCALKLQISINFYGGSKIAYYCLSLLISVSSEVMWQHEDSHGGQTYIIIHAINQGFDVFSMNEPTAKHSRVYHWVILFLVSGLLTELN